MKANVTITPSENTVDVFKCSVKIILTMHGFDAVGETQLYHDAVSYKWSNIDLGEIIKELPNDRFDKLIEDVRQFIRIKWDLCKDGKYKFTDDNCKFLIKDI